MYTVELTLEAYKALSKYLPEYSILIPVWRDAMIVFDGEEKPKGMTLRCDETQIEAMLCMAHLECPAALPAIQHAIDRLRL
jgi:hypothetical protein